MQSVPPDTLQHQATRAYYHFNILHLTPLIVRHDTGLAVLLYFHLTISFISALSLLYLTLFTLPPPSPPPPPPQASLSSFFTFAGKGSGLYSHIQTLPFAREYQFCAWFRVECFDTVDTQRADSFSGARLVFSCGRFVLQSLRFAIASFCDRFVL
jgi:hypothetical protein